MGETICFAVQTASDQDELWLLIVYFHCIGIQRLYIRLWWYGEIISLNPTTTGVEPSERSWRSKEHIFISMRTLIHRVFSRKSGYYTRLQKSGICIFILCALSATRNCVFSCQKKKKKIGMISVIWWDNLGKYTGNNFAYNKEKSIDS